MFNHLTFEAILEFFGVVAVIGGGVKIILSALSPFKDIKDRLNGAENKLDNDNKRFQDMEQEFKELKDLLNANNKLLIQLTEHILSGNDVDKLKEKRDELIACAVKR